jgi:hypothetical protein
MGPIAVDWGMFLLPAGTCEVVYAEDQPQYHPLPSLRTPDGRVVSQWLPTAEELDALMRGQPLTLVIHTFNEPLQPIQLGVGGMDLRIPREAADS